MLSFTALTPLRCRPAQLSLVFIRADVILTASNFLVAASKGD
ncbi:hypothetical protein [Micromonospora sp. NPDC005189]